MRALYAIYPDSQCVFSGIDCMEGSPRVTPHGPRFAFDISLLITALGGEIRIKPDGPDPGL